MLAQLPLIHILLILLSFLQTINLYAQELTFWDVSNYVYPGRGETAQVEDGLGGEILVSYEDLMIGKDYVSDEHMWFEFHPEIDEVPHGQTNDEIARSMYNTGPWAAANFTNSPNLIRQLGNDYCRDPFSENTVFYCIHLDFSNYKATRTGAATDGATWGNTLIALSDIYSGTSSTNSGYPWGISKVYISATTLSGESVNYTAWSAKTTQAGFSSIDGIEPWHDYTTQADAEYIVSGNPNRRLEGAPGNGVDAGMIYIRMPYNQRYTDVFLKFEMEDGNQKHAGVDYWGYGVLSETYSNVFPVEWADVRGEQINNDIQLRWETSKEENNALFSVERSIDGELFAQLGEVQATGNAETLSAYSFLDRSVPYSEDGKYYYRIKQLDHDGRFSYSAVIEVSYKFEDVFALKAYPNPTSSFIQVEIESASFNPVEIQIVDAQGKVISKDQIGGAPGRTFWQMRVADWTPGLYIVTAIEPESGKLYSQRFWVV